MEITQGLLVPTQADSVLSPQVNYGDPLTGIYFTTQDDQFGRITFENLDSIKVSRGELIPYEVDQEEGQIYCWVLKVKNSNWLTERFQYEKRIYGKSYEFGGNVDEMLTDFSHFVFRFHDEFVEAIARGFWVEKSNENLFGKELMKDIHFSHCLKPRLLKLRHIISFVKLGLTQLRLMN
jgi:hypothetical protein